MEPMGSYSYITLHLASLIPTHEPPSMAEWFASFKLPGPRWNERAHYTSEDRVSVSRKKELDEVVKQSPSS